MGVGGGCYRPWLVEKCACAIKKNIHQLQFDVSFSMFFLFGHGSVRSLGLCDSRGSHGATMTC